MVFHAGVFFLKTHAVKKSLGFLKKPLGVFHSVKNPIG
jgi:hypothetical protein